MKQSLAWLGAAALVGFLVPAVFSMGLGWERSLYLVAYIAIVGAFLALYFRRQPVTLARLAGDWRYALAGAALASLLLVSNVVAQPAAAVPTGGGLVFALLWIGLLYGAADGLFLNVMPALAVERAAAPPPNSSRAQRLVRGLLALAASLFVTVAYHLGYTEFQGPALLSVILGNAIITSAYLLSGSPLAAVATHVVMHVAAILRGMETTIQLPPHR